MTTAHDMAMLTDSLRRFLRDEVIPLEKKAGLSADVVPPVELRRQVRCRARELGLYGADMPPEAGGSGLALSERVLLDLEAFAHETVFFEDVLGGPGGPSSILLACNERQRERYLVPLVQGEISTCFALSEPEAGSDAGGLRLRRGRPTGHTC